MEKGWSGLGLEGSKEVFENAQAKTQCGKHAYQKIRMARKTRVACETLYRTEAKAEEETLARLADKVAEVQESPPRLVSRTTAALFAV